MLWPGECILQMLLGKNIRRKKDVIRHLWIISNSVVGKIFFKVLPLGVNEANLFLFLSPKLSSFQALLSGSSP